MKLHLPKGLLVAVLAAIALLSSTAWAGTGLYNNVSYLIGGTDTSGGGVNASTVTNITQEVSADNTYLTTFIDQIDASALSSFNVWADSPAHVRSNAEIKNWIVRDGATITVSQSTWYINGQPKYFNELNIQNLTGSANLAVTITDHVVSIDKVSGSMLDISNAGTLTIGTADSTTTLNGSITNTGTLTINGAITFKVDANSSFGMLSGGATTYSYNSENEEGFKTVAGAQYELIGENTGTIKITAEQEGMTITRDETTGNVTSVIFSDGGFTDDTFRINGSNINEAALIAETATTGVTATTKYNLVAGTLTVADDISTERLSYSGGTLVLGSNTLTIADGNTQLLLNTTGAGNVTLTADLELAQGQATQATGKLTISNGAQLALGNGDLWDSSAGTAGTGASISSFKGGVELDNGTIYVNNPEATINSLTVTAKGGVINAYDLANDTTKYLINLTDNTTLNGNLTYKNTWNTYVNVQNLTGSGNLIIDGYSRSTQDDSTFCILGATDYKGEVQMINKANNMTLSVAQDLGLNVRVQTTSGEMNLTGIAAGNQIILQGASGSMTAGSIVVADVEIKNSANGYYAGMEIATAADNDTMKYTGKITGDGNYIVIPIKTVDEQKVSVSTTTEFAGDTSGWTGKMEVVNATQNVIYSGSETINNSAIRTRNAENTTIDDPVMNLTIKHDSAAVKVNSTISGTVNMTVNAAQGATFSKDVTVKTTTLAAGTTATFNGTTDLGDLSLGAGLSSDTAAVSSTGALTIGTLTLDLSSYTTAGASYVLVSSTGGLTWNEQNVTMTGLADGLSASVSWVNTADTNAADVLMLNITSSAPTDVYVTGAGYDSESHTLTLNVGDADGIEVVLDANGNYNIAGLVGETTWDSIRQMLTEKGAESTVAITLAGAEGGDLVVGIGDTDGDPETPGTGNVSFYGKYYGEANEGASEDKGKYRTDYIPEPTTATLSLLALMGLAARRRRKA